LYPVTWTVDLVMQRLSGAGTAESTGFATRMEVSLTPGTIVSAATVSVRGSRETPPHAICITSMAAAVAAKALGIIGDQRLMFFHRLTHHISRSMLCLCVFVSVIVPTSPPTFPATAPAHDAHTLHSRPVAISAIGMPRPGQSRRPARKRRCTMMHGTSAVKIATSDSRFSREREEEDVEHDRRQVHPGGGIYVEARDHREHRGAGGTAQTAARSAGRDSVVSPIIRRLHRRRPWP
jgi:hypothetical protein